MALYNFHRVLIAAAGLFFLMFGLFLFRLWSASHGVRDPQLAGWASGSTPLVMGVISVAIAAGSVGYLIYFNRRLRVLRAGQNI